MSNNQQGEMLNRLKAVLADQGRTSRWLAEQIGKSENTVSRWCANKVQPSIQQLNEIASILDVDLRMLIVSTKNNNYGSSDK
jgi:transcriptional regulator with XRE-family HTH domain